MCTMFNLRLKTTKDKRGYLRYRLLLQTKKNPLRNFKLSFVRYSDIDLV